MNLLPLIFYVKSILVILKPQKLPFCPYVQLWILDVWIYLTFSSVTFWENLNSKPPKYFKWHFLTLWTQPKLISRKIRVAGKLLTFHAVEYPQSKFLIKRPRSVADLLSTLFSPHQDLLFWQSYQRWFLVPLKINQAFNWPQNNCHQPPEYHQNIGGGKKISRLLWLAIF